MRATVLLRLAWHQKFADKHLVYEAGLSLLGLIADTDQVLQDFIKLLRSDLVEQPLDSLLLLDLLGVVSHHFTSLQHMSRS